MTVKELVEMTTGVDYFEYYNNTIYYGFSYDNRVKEKCANKKVIAVRFYIDSCESRCCEITFKD